eukprot:scaffold49110_cov18-Tisochrysis_lutea.AAC.1
MHGLAQRCGFKWARTGKLRAHIHRTMTITSCQQAHEGWRRSLRRLLLLNGGSACAFSGH